MCVCGTSSPTTLTPTRLQGITALIAFARYWATCIRCAAVSGGTSSQWFTSWLGITIRCPSRMGWMVRMEKQVSSFQRKWPGSSPARILVNTEAMAGLAWNRVKIWRNYTTPGRPARPPERSALHIAERQRRRTHHLPQHETRAHVAHARHARQAVEQEVLVLLRSAARR